MIAGSGFEGVSRRWTRGGAALDSRHARLASVASPRRLLTGASAPTGDGRRSLNGVVLVGLAGVAWGTAPVAFDLVYDRTALTSVAISAHRLAIAALVLILLAALAGQLRAAWRAWRRQPAAVAAIGVGVAGYQALWFAAITYVGVSIATVVSLGLAPVLVTGWESWRARRRPTAAQLLVIAAAVTGLVLVSLSSAHPVSAGTNPALGLLLATASGTLYAATTVLGRRVAPQAAPLALTTATITIGAGCLVPLALAVGPVLTVDPAAMLALAYLGVVTMAVGYLLLYAGLRTARASAATIATLLEPVTATLLAIGLLGERLTAAGITGIVLILSAVAALHRRQPKSGPVG